MSDKPLTATEAQTLAFCAQGYNDKEIASAMHCTVGVIRNRLYMIRLKLAAFAPESISLSRRFHLIEFYKQHLAPKEEE
jgi:DNA-binding NarL/FixJ family response regulator